MTASSAKPRIRRIETQVCVVSESDSSMPLRLALCSLDSCATCQQSVIASKFPGVRMHDKRISRQVSLQHIASMRGHNEKLPSSRWRHTGHQHVMSMDHQNCDGNTRGRQEGRTSIQGGHKKGVEKAWQHPARDGRPLMSSSTIRYCPSISATVGFGSQFNFDNCHVTCLRYHRTRAILLYC
jgi:hypothetical protein